jgi:hypothetical protein
MSRREVLHVSPAKAGIQGDSVQAQNKLWILLRLRSGP